METMFIKNAFRSISRRKVVSSVIIISLVAGFTNIFLLSGFLFNEYSIDSFHQKKRQIFRMQSDDPWVEGNKMNYITFATPVFLKNNFPEVTNFCHWNKQGFDELKVDNNVYYQNIDAFETEASFFTIFSYRFVEGNPTNALSDKNNIVITEKAAHKLFGDKKALGKTIVFKSKGVEKVFNVSAVINQPGESHLKFDLITSIEGKDLRGTDAYLLLKEGTNHKAFQEKINAHKSEIPFFWEGKTVNYYLNDLESINITKEVKTKIYISLGIAITILVIAFFNYISVYMNMIFDRIKEMSIVRIMGGTYMNILKIIAIEIFLLITVSTLLSFPVIKIVLPAFNQLNESKLLFSNFMDFHFLLIVSAFISLAFIVSCFIVLLSIRGIFHDHHHYFAKTPTYKNKKLFTISTVQYTISIILIICTITFYRQINFIRQKEIGLNRNVVEFRLPEMYRDKKNEMKDVLLSNPVIEKASVCQASPVREGAMIRLNYEDMNKNKEYTVLFFQGDEEYLKTLHIELTDGHEFSQTAADTKKMCYINQAMVKFFQMKDPIGKLIPGSDMEIAGVLKNFHWTGLETTVPPAIVTMSKSGRNLLVKIKDGHQAEGINLIKTTWSRITHGYPFEYYTIGDLFNEKHEKYERQYQLVSFYCIVSILLSSMGLTALSLFSIRRKVKEIGIRKVNGAHMSEILIFINQKLVGGILLGLIIACPVAGFLMHKWLQNFAYKTELSWWVFGVAGAVAVVVALLTVSWQSWKAATRNPVESLRYE
ncbi:MAG TPA: ABC transporter permease [Bacteroidales bacterium]